MLISTYMIWVELSGADQSFMVSRSPWRSRIFRQSRCALTRHLRREQARLTSVATVIILIMLCKRSQGIGWRGVLMQEDATFARMEERRSTRAVACAATFRRWDLGMSKDRAKA